MNKEDIIKLAQKANEGFLDKQKTMDLSACLIGTDAVMYFAASIRFATKEEDAGICEALSMGFHSPHEYIADCADAIRASK